MTSNHPNTGSKPLVLSPLPGSDRRPAPQIRNAAPIDPEQTVTVTVVLRRSPPGGPSADDADVDLVTDTLTGLGLQVVEAEPRSRIMLLSGPVAEMERAFGTALEMVESRGPDGQFAQHRHRSGVLSVPAALTGIVVAVLGLDDRPQARSYLRAGGDRPATTSYTPVELGRIYRFPPATSGAGQSLALIELGGGYEQSELSTYFEGLGITTPTVTAVGVDGAKNSPGEDPQGADGEVLLDIEVAGALAPGAAQSVYFAPNTDAGFLNAVSKAVHASPTPVAISISWGQSEDQWTEQARQAMDAAFADAVALGITVTVAAGDSGSSDGDSSAAAGPNHVDFPAASPHVLACGGTSLHADPATGTVRTETVWNDGVTGGATGGGFSDAFGRPSWQSTALQAAPSATGRGVPDVAANADPDTGYQVLVHGKSVVYGGTSAVAPLWAALVARLAEAAAQAPRSLAESLYKGAQPKAATPGLRDITAGNNGAYPAQPGWDPCTGLGAPDGTALLSVVFDGLVTAGR